MYAEVVARRQEKPRQVATEIENAFSHLATYFLSLDEDKKQTNLGQALGHIHRATLDCQKILWITLLKRAVFLEKTDIINHASNVSLEIIYAQWNKVEKIASESRIIESQNTGNDFEKELFFIKMLLKNSKTLKTWLIQ